MKKKEKDNLLNENKLNDTELNDNEEKKKKSKKLLLIIGIVVIIVAVLGVGAFIFITKSNDDGFKAPESVATPSPKPESTENPNAIEPEATDVLSTEELKDVTEQDKKWCAYIHKCMYNSLVKYKLYNEIAQLMENGYVLIEIQPGGKANGGVQLNTLLSKALVKLPAPTTKDTDTYYALVLEADKSTTDYSTLIHVIPGSTGILPSKDEIIAQANAMNGTTEGGTQDTPSATGNTGETSAPTSVNENVEALNKKSDANNCTSIESCVNAALANEDIYKETAKLLVKGPVIFEIQPSSPLTISSATLMSKELIDIIGDKLEAPKEKGKNTYYVCITGTVKTNIISIDKVSVITGKTGITPTERDFK